MDSSPSPAATSADGRALVVIDVQHCFTRPAGSFDRAAESGDLASFFERVDDIVIPNLQRLLEAYRGNGAPIFFTEMGSLRPDGADLPLYGRRANRESVAATGRPVFPRLDDPDARTDDRIKPEPGEIVLRKTTTGTVTSSPIAQNLRALGCEAVCVAGLVTDCCVSQTARELADRDFDVSLVDDACATYATHLHRAALESFACFYGSVCTTDEALASLG